MERIIIRFLQAFLATLKFLLGIQNPTIHGHAKWMTKLEQRLHFSPRNRGLVLAKNRRLNLEDSFRHLALIAPTGSGKTVRYIVPNILLCQGSMVITDPSGEIFQKTAGHLTSRKFRIQVLRPESLSQSLRFNPLASFRSPQELKQIATILARINNGNDQFWVTGAVQALYLGLLAVVSTGDDRFIHLPNVRLLINRMGVGGEDQALKSFMAGRLDQAAATDYHAFMNQEDKIKSGFLASARSALDAWSDPDIAKLTASNTVSIAALREGRQPTAIYLIVSEDKLQYFAVILNLFYAACFEFCLKNHGPTARPVFFFLDEFGNLPAIPNFMTYATTLRKRRVSLSLVLQDTEQLTHAYGLHEARTILSGAMANKLFLAGLDGETAERVQKGLGQATAQEWVKEGPYGKGRLVTTSKSLFSADRLRTMHRNEGLLISGNRLPAKFRMKPYFLDRRLKQYTQRPPPPFQGGDQDENISYLQF